MAPRNDRLDMPFEFKDMDTGQGEFEGYGSIFGNVDNDHDIMARGAFAESLKKRMPALLWQHDRYSPIGVFKEVREDNKGLWVKGQFLLQGKGLEAYELVKIGAIRGLSVGFRTVESNRDPKTGVRTITKADLFEISAVTFASNEVAKIHAVKNSDDIKTKRDLEHHLMTLGVSKSEAKSVASKFYSEEDLARRDAVRALNSLKTTLKG